MVELEEGNYDSLVEVMGHLLAVKDRQASTDVMFEPLKEMTELLSAYDQEMSEETLQQLEVMDIPNVRLMSYRAVFSSG